MVFNPNSVQPQQLELTIKKSMTVDDFLLKFSRVPSNEKLFFVQNLGIMLKAGVSILTALQTLAKQAENKKFALIITETAQAVEKGKTLTDSLKLNQKIFGELFINMIEAGEISGKLESVLAQLYLQMKKHHELVSKIKGAMTYPAVIMFAMVGIGIFMMLIIVPQLTGMLKEAGASLPLPTKILIAVSDFLTKNTLLCLIISVVTIFTFIKTIQTKSGKYYFDLFLIKLPIFGKIIKKVNLAKFSRTISSLLKTDIMIIKTFQITATVLGNIHYRNAVEEIAEKIKKGTPINEVIATYPKLFPPIVIQMIAIGEQTGELDNILVELAEFYEDEIDEVMTNLPSIIEPVLILVLGCGVGAMAVAILMPMYTMTSAI
ncbi:MAG: type II secretion system F family protein [Candidatus Falkowbacteria bacterium]